MVILLYIPLFGGLEKHHLQSEASKMMSWFNLHLMLCDVYTQGTFMAFSYTSPATTELESDGFHFIHLFF